MSLQLIVYPQSFEGQFNQVSVPFFSQHVSNYSFTSGYLGSGFSLTVANPVDTVMSNVAPNNSWNTWNSTGGVWGAVSVPSISSNKITLDSASSASSTGIFQLISNLVVGSVYELKLEMLAGTTGILIIGHSTNWTFNGVNYEPILFNSITPSVSTQTFTFTATSAEMVLVLNYLNDDNTNLEIGSVSIKETIASAPTTYDYTDGSVIVDLYSDETIPLTLSIDNFKNVAEKVQSYSKSFDLPATKRNNKIFSSLFDVTRSVQSDVYAFNPYRKTKAILKEDGYTIFDGYLRLTEIKEKQEEISYVVNLYSDTITLADTLKEKKFKDIDFNELLHTYNKTVIKSSFEGALTLDNALPTGTFAGTAGATTTDVLKYPFCKWNGDTTFDNGQVKLNKLEDAFRPWLRCKYLVDRIITEAGFTYSSDFLNSSDFTRLFMDFNFGNDSVAESTASTADIAFLKDTPAISTSFTNLQVQAFSSSLSQSSGILPWNSTTHKFTATQDNQIFQCIYNANIKNHDSSSRDVTFRWVHKDSSGAILNEIDLAVQSIVAGKEHIFQGSFIQLLNNTDTLEIQAKSSSGSLVKQNGGGFYITCAITDKIHSGILNSKRGDLGQYDFLKGIFTMFNLLVLQDADDPRNLIIEPYKAVFIDDSLSQYITINEHDWTNKVDISAIDLKPVPLKKKVKINYLEDESDYALGVYKNATSYDYGSQEIDATQFDILDGEQEIKATPFSSTFIKPIFETFTSEMTIPVIYSGKEDGTFEGFDNKPRILYDVSHTTKITMGSSTYYIPPQNGQSSENQASFCQFAHVTEIPTTVNSKDYNFGQGQLIGTIGSSPVDNLFNTYWLPYYDELYNSDTRIMTLKVYLTPSEISNFNFYDKVTIKNRQYRVNKIDYKPYELSNVEFILIA